MEERLGLGEIGRFESFAEPAVDGREEIMGSTMLALITPVLGEARSGAYFQQARALPACQLDGMQEIPLAVSRRTLNCDAPHQTQEFRFVRAFLSIAGQ